MCGIFGVTERNLSTVSKMMQICSHRGPDNTSIWQSDKVTLGHNLLSITSTPSIGKQPFKTYKGNILIYNGEIFNYNSLLKRFEDKFQPKTTCDTELLGWLLDNFSYQEVVSNILDSMHSFAYYNINSNELILSRDHVGIKPLFFSNINNAIIFSSEIKALLNFIPNSSTINRLALACTSLIGSNVLRETIFKGIYKVLPGETLVYDLNKKKISNKFRSLIRPNSNKTIDLQEFKSKTLNAINQSTLGIRKFGIFLSGGIDSSIISYGLKKKLGKLNSFTNFMEPNVILEDEDHNSDADIARKFAKYLKLNHTEIKITPENFANNWDDSVKYVEEPRYNWCLPMYYYTNNILSKHQTIVTMAGDIGDEILGGYPKYFRFKNMLNKPKNWNEFIRVWMKKWAAPIILNMKFDFEDLHSLLLEALPEEVWNPDDVANSAMALDCITTVPEDFFSRNDRFGMRFSMEGRFPLASKDYMQYCLNIKSDHKIGKEINQTKLPIKEAFKDILPDYLINKPKTGWSAPIMNWLSDNKVLQDKFNHTIKKDDAIKDMLSFQNIQIPNNKRRIIYWLFRTWSQQFEMSN
mgnify:FL=1